MQPQRATLARGLVVRCQLTWADAVGLPAHHVQRSRYCEAHGHGFVGRPHRCVATTPACRCRVGGGGGRGSKPIRFNELRAGHAIGDRRRGGSRVWRLQPRMAEQLPPVPPMTPRWHPQQAATRWPLGGAPKGRASPVQRARTVDPRRRSGSRLARPIKQLGEPVLLADLGGAHAAPQPGAGLEVRAW
jgi:hypothetical protein